MDPGLKQPRFAPRIHAAHARDDAGLGLTEQPGEFALDLQREFPGRRHDERERSPGRRHDLGSAHQGRGDGEPVGHRLPGPGLGRDEEVATAFRFEHGGLHGRGVDVIAFGERASERGDCRRKCHALFRALLACCGAG